MNISNVLVIYKKSAYQIYFQERGLSQIQDLAQMAKFKAAHEEHNRALEGVENSLRQLQMKYRLIHRAKRFDYSPYDLVISVGGDGTLLEAAKGIRGQTLLGVNSDPKRSVGMLCGATAKSFQRVLEKYTKNKIKPKLVSRLQLSLNGKQVDAPVLNDVLICHSNPAAMSRYQIGIGRLKEEQRSSGVWISTAAGSTGATLSSGGKVLSFTSQLIQYRPRELYKRKGHIYKLSGGLLKSGSVLRLVSNMRNGIIYLDGAHHRVPFQFGDELVVFRDSKKIKLLLE